MFTSETVLVLQGEQCYREAQRLFPDKTDYINSKYNSYMILLYYYVL